jgi:hypothetical protein
MVLLVVGVERLRGVITGVYAVAVWAEVLVGVGRVVGLFNVRGVGGAEDVLRLFDRVGGYFRSIGILK